jgi:hypothetical protein
LSDKILLDPNQLTMADLRRAKVALGGRNPWELLDDPIEAVVITIFCLRSRDDPEFTMDDAALVPLGEFEMAEDDEPPPPTAGPEPNGEEPGSDAATSSKPKRRSRASTASGPPGTT